MLIVVISLAAVQAACSSSKTSKHSEHQLLLKRYYHADGYIKAIGHVAYRTIYSSNSHTRKIWKRRLRQLEQVRNDTYTRLHRLTLGVPPHYSAWLCIHHYEGSWTDSGYPFWGGLQMDKTFQSTYAAAYAKTWHTDDPYKTLGTADHWTPLVQMWVAEEAYKSRGFYPWPNTARYCDLI